MKKLSLILVLLLVFGMTSVFAAEPSVSGVFSTNYTQSGVNVGRLRLNVQLPVGDYVNVVMDLRDDTNVNDYLTFNQVYATTDISGIFGIDVVGINLWLGNFEYWIANWNSATSTNRARFVETFAVGGADASPDIALDFNVMDLFTLMTYAQFNGDEGAYKFGLKLGDVVPGLNAIASYTGTTDDSAQYLKVEAGYMLALGDDMSLKFPVNFIADLQAEDQRWSVGVVFDGMGFHAGVGAGTSSLQTNALDVLDVQLSYTIAGVKIYANGFMDPADGAPDFIEALDFGVAYNLAGNMVYVGYVADLGVEQAIPLMMDDSTGRHGVTGGGVYLASYISF
jgi:hypothetical protein